MTILLCGHESNMTSQDSIICEPAGPAQGSVIWMHGLGADANDFVGIIDQLGLTENVRFIFPNAPYKNITVNQGMRMRAWYDIAEFNMLRNEDHKGVDDSQQRINKLIDDQVAQGIPSNKIMLAGFSQGGAMALYTGLRNTKKLAGLIVLSAYLPFIDTFDPTLYVQNKATPIFMAHGLFDPVVQYGMGHATYTQLQKHGYNVEWTSYPMVHTVNLDEIYAIGDFINRCLANA